MCSDTSGTVLEFAYMLCPNEEACKYERYLTAGDDDIYEMFEGRFLKGDLCNFRISAPGDPDMNDVMILRLEHYARCIPFLVKGESLTNPMAFYQINKGADYTALRGINLYLLFIATEENSGDFAFRIKYNAVNGPGKTEPTEVTWEVEPQKPENIGTVETETVINKPKTTESGTTESGTTASGTTESGATASGTTASGITAVGATANGTTESGTTASGITGSGSTASGTTTSITTASGTPASGNTANGATASGTPASGTTVSGATASGST